MQCKHLLKIILIGFLALGMNACASHKKPLNEAQMDGKSRGGAGEETYTQGVEGSQDNCGECNNAKCRQGRQVAGAEQHYFFDYDCNEVRADAVNSIQLQANYLVKHPNLKIRLEGNADDRGSREYNVALGERRARSVLDVLKQYGVASSQVTVVSFGAEKPAVGGDDEKSYQCNRRVDLKYCE